MTVVSRGPRASDGHAALASRLFAPLGRVLALALEDGRIRSVLSRAVEVASARAGELGGPRS